jgi:hypothetical protein
MSNPASAFQPAIDALEEEFSGLERKANGLLQTINLLREKAGQPPRPGGWNPAGATGDASGSGQAPVKMHSDTFTGKKLGSAVREYLEMRKKSGLDAPATSREIFDALKEGGFISGAKDDATGLVVLRTMLRKNTVMFAKLQNGKFGLRAWYPNLKAKEAPAAAEGDQDGDDVEDTEAEEADEATTTDKAAAAS